MLACIWLLICSCAGGERPSTNGISSCGNLLFRACNLIEKLASQRDLEPHLRQIGLDDTLLVNAVLPGAIEFAKDQTDVQGPMPVSKKTLFAVCCKCQACGAVLGANFAGSCGDENNGSVHSSRHLRGRFCFLQSAIVKTTL